MKSESLITKWNRYLTEEIVEEAEISIQKGQVETQNTKLGMQMEKEFGDKNEKSGVDKSTDKSVGKENVANQ